MADSAERWPLPAVSTVTSSSLAMTATRGAGSPGKRSDAIGEWGMDARRARRAYSGGERDPAGCAPGLRILESSVGYVVIVVIVIAGQIVGVLVIVVEIFTVDAARDGLFDQTAVGDGIHDASVPVMGGGGVMDC